MCMYIYKITLQKNINIQKLKTLFPFHITANRNKKKNKKDHLRNIQKEMFSWRYDESSYQSREWVGEGEAFRGDHINFEKSNS